MRRRGLAALAVAGLLSAATASAAGGGTATGTLTPAKAGAASAASVTLTGPFTDPGGTTLTGVPTSIAVTVQHGFTSTALKAVSATCTLTQANSSSGCPAASQIGTGSVAATLLGSPLTVPAALYMGPALQSGDIASVVLVGQALGNTLAAAARLFTPPQGGLELVLAGLPSLPVTLNSIALSVHAMKSVTTTKTKTKFKGHGKHRKRHKIKVKVTTVYSLVTNPPTCSGHWTGQVTMTFATGTFSAPLTVACTS